jgi:hypothetical protein
MGDFSLKIEYESGGQCWRNDVIRFKFRGHYHCPTTIAQHRKKRPANGQVNGDNEGGCGAASGHTLSSRVLHCFPVMFNVVFDSRPLPRCFIPSNNGKREKKSTTREVQVQAS